MTSIERREGRYQRRKKAREEKALKHQRSFKEVFSIDNLWASAHDVCKGSGWKTSIINFKTNMLQDVMNRYYQLMSGVHNFQGFVSFQTVEHGKLRQINAIKVQDRLEQKCLCKYFLIDVLSRSFIYDNGACLRGRGYHFQIKRMKKHLRDHYRKYGLEGGIYQFDFKGYFSSIPHEGIKQRLRGKIQDDRIYQLVCQLIDDFKGLKQDSEHNPASHGIGLGSEISQIIGLEYASPIDHFVKDQCGIHGYGRYNDDGYVISNDMDELRRIQAAIHELAEEIGIRINAKKDRITPFEHHSFTFLKIRFTLTESGHVVAKISRAAIRNVRRKMKKLKKMLNEDRIEFEDIVASYQSWRAYARGYDSNDTLYNMDAFFLRLFEREVATYRKEITCSHRAVQQDGLYQYIGIDKDSKKSVNRR